MKCCTGKNEPICPFFSKVRKMEMTICCKKGIKMFYNLTDMDVFLKENCYTFDWENCRKSKPRTQEKTKVKFIDHILGLGASKC
jgi:hypothetical protein